MNQAAEPTVYTVFWQPGCSSCLRAKEFLKKNGIEFLSVNVREQEEAAQVLDKLGARSIPVVSRGNDFVYAQDIDVLAEFVGIKSERCMLPMDELFQRIELLIAATQRYVQQLDGDSLDNNLPGRDRSYFSLAYHALMVPLAFLDAVKGTELSYEYFERTPPSGMTTVAKLIDYAGLLAVDVNRCRQEYSSQGLPATVLTYYGEHSTHSVLERTAWHTAHHVRQLMELVRAQGIEPDGALGDEELEGLPLPDEVYDDEVAMS